MAGPDEAVLVADQRGRFVFASAAACRILGYSAEELLRLTIRDTYAPDEMDLSELRFREMQRGRQQSFRRRARRKDGVYILVEVDSKMLEDGRYRFMMRAIG